MRAPVVDKKPNMQGNEVAWDGSWPNGGGCARSHKASVRQYLASQKEAWLLKCF